MLSELRDQLVNDLSVDDNVDWQILTEWPERPNPPVAFVVPSSPYIVKGPAFGDYLCSFDIVLLAGRGPTKYSLAQLEAMTESTLANTADWFLTGVDQPSLVTVNNTDWLGTIVHIHKSARI